MAQKKKYKKMTAAEKKQRKEIRERMRATGMLPPVKSRLNRKKFLQEAFAAYEELEIYRDTLYLRQAISCMVSRKQEKDITSEQVGVLKVMKLATAIRDFERGKLNAGETSYSFQEFYEQVVQPIKGL